MPDNEIQHDAFLSYCRADRELAARLRTMLNMRVWWDPEIPEGSPDWRDDVAKNILRSRAVIVLVTQESITRKEVKREVQFADEKNKPLVGIWIGTPRCPPDVAGLELLLSTAQRIYSSAIDEQSIARCRAALQAIDEAAVPAAPNPAGPCPYLDPLELTEKDVPSLGCLRLIHHACESMLRRLVAEGSWEQARELLGDMAAFGVQPGAFDKVDHWMRCVRIYNDIASRCVTWPDVMAKVRKEIGENNLCAYDECSAISERLRQGWHLVLEESCEKVFNCLCFGPKDHSFHYAIKHFECLKPELREPLASIVPRESLALEQNVYDLAEKSLGAYAPAFRASAARCSDFLQRPWPPESGELEELRSLWANCQSGMAAVRQFAEFLRKNARRDNSHASESSPVHDIVRRLEGLRALLEMPPFERVERHARQWQSALVIMMASTGDPPPQARADLAEAGETFPQARDQANCLLRWHHWQKKYPSAQPDFASPHFVAQETARIGEGLECLGVLGTRVLDPATAYRAEDGQEPGESARCLTGWIHMTDTRRRDLDRDGTALRLLEHLGHSRLADLGHVLDTARDQLGDDLPHWGRLCQALQSLGECVPRLFETAIAGKSTLPAALLIDGDTSQLEQAEKLVADAVDRLGEVRYRGAPCGVAAFPAVGRLGAMLPAAKQMIAAWQNLLEAMSNEDFSAALEAADQLETLHPDDPALVALLRQLCERANLRKADSDRFREERQWPQAGEALEDLAGGCRSLAKSRPDAATLASTLENLAARAEEQAKVCANAQEDEPRLLEAAELLEQGRIHEAAGAMEKTGTANPASVLWKRVVNAFQALEASTTRDESCN